MHRLALIGLVFVVACVGRDLGSDDESTSGEDSSTTTPTTGPAETSPMPTTVGPPPVTTLGDGTTTVVDPGSTGTTGEVSPCVGFNLDLEGTPCEVEGVVCEVGDFCWWSKHECIEGIWTAFFNEGCADVPIRCIAEPEDLDFCEGAGEVCDPDGDCLDVLECNGERWEYRSVCTEVACENVVPVHGQPCSPNAIQCGLEDFCGGIEREFFCSEGWWLFYSTQTCATEPIACVDGPVAGDACDTEMEQCDYPAPQLPPVVCTGGIWLE